MVYHPERASLVEQWVGLFRSQFIALRISSQSTEPSPHSQNAWLWEIGVKGGVTLLTVTPRALQSNLCASHLCKLGLCGFRSSSVKEDGSSREHIHSSVKLLEETAS